MQGIKRRKEIKKILKKAENPVSGTKLASLFSVSRQVIVQDIAILRAEKEDIHSTNRGYIIKKNNNLFKKEVKVKHDDKDIENELNIIVDLGGKVKDVSVIHETYGKVTAPLEISSRYDVENFIKEMTNGEATPLKHLTKDFHYHTIETKNEEIFNLIELKLKEKGYLIK